MIALIVALLALAYFGWFCFKAFDPQALAKLYEPRVIAATAIAAGLYALIVPVSAMAWRKLLVPHSALPGWKELCGIMGFTQLAKYLPGNVAQHASRAMLAMSRGMTFRRFATSVTIETILAVLACAAVAGVFTVSGSASPRVPLALVIWFPWVVLGLCVGVAFAPEVVRCLSRITRDSRIGIFLSSWQGEIPGRPSQLMAFAGYCLNYLVIGLGWFLIARALGLGSGYSYGQLTSVFAISWLAGFFAPGLPAGIGVREGVMAMMLGGVNASGEVLSAILAMRIATIAADLVWFFLGGWLLARNATGNET
ncbi:MAG TPA: lysylphosphatidylglycerol synthase domain-containing protein [Lysobacter sp.]